MVKKKKGRELLMLNKPVISVKDGIGKKVGLERSRIMRRGVSLIVPTDSMVLKGSTCSDS